MAERLIREAVRRSTGNASGNVTYRDRTQAGAGTPSSRGAMNAPDGSLYFVLGIDSFDDETKTF